MTIRFRKSVLSIWLALLLGCLSTWGCNRVFVTHPDAIEFKHPTISYSTEAHIQKRVADYLNKHPDIDLNVKSALLTSTIIKGMDQDQVLVVVGEPSKRKIVGNEIEEWTYTESLSGDAFREAKFPGSWYYNWAKLTFKRGKLADMAVQQVEWKTDP